MRQRYLILFAMTFGISAANGLLPYSLHLIAFFGLVVICGAFTGGLDTGGNVLTLDIWRGHGGTLGSIPFISALQLARSLVPVVAKPFLTPDRPHQTANLTTVEYLPEEEFGIRILFPILAAAGILVSLGFLTFHFISKRNPSLHQELRKPEQEANMTLDEIGTPKNGSSNTGCKVLFISVMIAYFFMYVGMEVMYGTFVTTFSVECELQLTKQQGATVTAIFWGSFAAMRFLSIFFALKLSPLQLLIVSFVLSLAGSIGLVIYGETSLLALQICSGIMGVAMGPTLPVQCFGWSSMS